VALGYTYRLMIKFIPIMLLLLVSQQIINAQVFISGGVGKILHHSELYEPSVIEDGFIYQFIGEISQVKTWKSNNRPYELGIGYEYRHGENEYSNPMYGIPWSHELNEHSIPLALRFNLRKRPNTQVLWGPLLTLTRQDYSVEYGSESELNEAIYLASPGMSVLLRYVPTEPDKRSNTFIAPKSVSMLEFNWFQLLLENSDLPLQQTI